MDLLIQLVTDPAGFYDAHQLLIAQIGVNALLALSIYVTLSCGVLSLANVGFMAIGAYVSVLLSTRAGLPYPLALAAGTAAAGAIAVPLGLVTLRLSGVFLAIATLGFGQVVVAVILNLPVTGEGQGLLNLGADPSPVPVLASLAIAGYLLWHIARSRFGEAWTAIREDPIAAETHGIDVTREQVTAFVLGSLLAAFAGGVEAHLNFFVDPTGYPFTRMVSVLVYAVFGGIGSVAGPVLGATVLTALPEVVRFARDYRDAVYGVVLLAVVLLRPQGLIGGRGGAGWLRREAMRVLDRVRGAARA